MKRILWAFTLIVLITLSSLASAHSGRTDAYGGHWDRKTGIYHFHNIIPSTTPKPAATKKTSAKATPKPASFVEEETYMYGMTNRSDVNVWEAPSTDSKLKMILPDKGTTVEIIAIATDSFGDVWYRTSIGDKKAFIFSGYIDVLWAGDY